MMEDQLQREVVAPWRQDRPFTIAGKLARRRDDVAEIRDTHTDEPRDAYALRHNESMRRSGIMDGVTDRDMLPIEAGEDRT
jgi:hypothetical protein